MLRNCGRPQQAKKRGKSAYWGYYPRTRYPLYPYHRYRPWPRPPLTVYPPYPRPPIIGGPVPELPIEPPIDPGPIDPDFGVEAMPLPSFDYY